MILFRYHIPSITPTPAKEYPDQVLLRALNSRTLSFLRPTVRVGEFISCLLWEKIISSISHTSQQRGPCPGLPERKSCLKDKNYTTLTSTTRQTNSNIDSWYTSFSHRYCLTLKVNFFPTSGKNRKTPRPIHKIPISIKGPPLLALHLVWKIWQKKATPSTRKPPTKRCRLYDLINLDDNFMTAIYYV